MDKMAGYSVYILTLHLIGAIVGCRHLFSIAAVNCFVLNTSHQYVLRYLKVAIG